MMDGHESDHILSQALDLVETNFPFSTLNDFELSDECLAQAMEEHEKVMENQPSTFDISKLFIFCLL